MAKSKTRKNDEEVKRDRARSASLSTTKEAFRREGSCKKRNETLKKKANELGILCGAEVCIVICDPNGDLEVWPPNPHKARGIIMKFKDKVSSGKKHEENRPSDFLNAEKMKILEEKTKGFEKGLEICEEKVDLEKFSEDSLGSLTKALDSKIHALDQRIEALLEKDKHVDYGVGNFGGDVEGADNLAANLMGFENFAERSYISNVYDIINIPPVVTPSANFWYDDDLLQRTSMSTDFMGWNAASLPPVEAAEQNFQFQHMLAAPEPVHDPQQFTSPLYEALPFSLWSSRY